MAAVAAAVVPAIVLVLGVRTLEEISAYWYAERTWPQGASR